MKKAVGFIEGVIIGLIVGGCFLFATWLSQYVAGMPWFVAAFLRVMGAWFIAKIGLSVSMWPYILGIPATLGGIIGAVTTHD